MTTPLLQIENLHASVEGTPILRGVDLTLPPGQVHALMGPNGSGKSTLANVLLGHPAYEVTKGGILLHGQDVTELATEERARLGMFLAFQDPVEVPGVSLLNFLRSSLGAVRGEDIPVRQFQKELKASLAELEMDASFARRHLNDGFSGGEKKRSELLQLSLLAPRLAILDETDSGLDIDALGLVGKAVAAQRGPTTGFLVITHYMRILTQIAPDRVHVLLDGRIAQSGGPELAQSVEEAGYGALRKQLAEAS